MPIACKKTRAHFIVWLSLLALPPPLPASGDQTAPSSCNPVVRLAVEQASLQRTLTDLSTDYGFSLVFPAGMEQPVSLQAELPLEQLLKTLTTGLSTSFIHGADAGCGGSRLTRLVVYPFGEQGQPAPGSGAATAGKIEEPERDPDYIYVEDMELYVEEVLLRKRRPELQRLTPEQRADYRDTRRRMKKTLGPKLKSGELRREQRDNQDTPPGQTGTEFNAVPD
jgi:hypothetical protein